MEKSAHNMDKELIALVLKEIEESSVITEATIILHGGEPLLDKNLVNIFFDLLKKTIKTKKVIIKIQTNGTLIDDDFIEIYKKQIDYFDIQIGISLDGYQELNDTYRIKKDGIGSFNDIMRGIDLLIKNNIDYGIISVINSNFNNGKIFYDFLKSLRNLKGLHFLLSTEIISNLDIAANSINELFYCWFFDSTCKFYIAEFLNTISNIKDEQNIDCSKMINCFDNLNCFSIEPSGEISNCDCISDKRAIYGNINQLHIDEIIHQKQFANRKLIMDEYKRIRNCFFCKHIRCCNAGCPGVSGHENFCYINKSCFDYILNTVENCGDIKNINPIVSKILQ